LTETPTIQKYLSRTDVLDKGYVELIDVMGNDDTVVSAARVSYLGESKGPKKDRGLIRYMMKNRHTSPFEHVVFQWKIKCPLFVRSQWHRHRTWSYNELSRRYTSEDIEFYIPDEWRAQDNNNLQGSDGEVKDTDSVYRAFYQSMAVGKQNYSYLLAHGVAREMARMVLPQNLYTIFYGTVDLHNLLHFIGLRADEHAQLEIQQYAIAMEEMIQTYVPVSKEAWDHFVR